jgi:hypothetical protein
LSDFEDYGIDLTEGSTLMRLAISNLLASPPRKDTSQGMVIACKNDDTFAQFLKNCGGGEYY